MTTTKVNSEFIAVNAISGTIIADGAITSTHLAANSVDTSELVTGSIDTIHIAANQVTSAKIVSDAVLTRHIADDQVTQALIAVNSVGINELAVSDGSSGQALTTNGSGTLSFSTISGGVDGISTSADATAMTITSGEHVLIGVSSEYSGTSANLTVKDAIDVGTNEADEAQIRFTRSATTGIIGSIGSKWTGYGEGSVIKFHADNVGGGSQASSMTFHTNNNNSLAERMIINSSGNVGIGTSSPATTLHTTGTIGAFHGNNDNRILMYNNGTVGSINVTYGTTGPYLPLTFLTGDTERMRIDISGNVGIGTTSPAVSLDVGSKTDAIKVPNGTTAQKPTAATGMIRYNTTNTKLEAYIGSDWANLKTDPQDLTQISGLQVWADVTGGISSTTVADLSGNNRTGTLNSATTHKGTLSGNTYFEAFGSNTITYAAGVLPNFPYTTGNACTFFFVCTNKKTNNTYATYLGSVQSTVSYQIIRHNGASVNYNIYAENLNNWQITATNAVPVNATISEAYILIFTFKPNGGNSDVNIYKHENGNTTSETHSIGGNNQSFELTDNNATVTIGTSSWSNEYLNAGIFAWGATNTEMSSADRQIIYDYYADKGLAN